MWECRSIAAMGLSINGYKAIVEMQFADFVGFNQLWTYWLSHIIVGWKTQMWLEPGGGTQAGPFIPRLMKLGLLKHLAKSGISCFSLWRKRLLNASINDPNPVLFFEHKQYIVAYQDVPIDYYTLPIGKAALIKEGKVTIIELAAVHWALIPYQIILKFQQIY
jgi:2-oxoisovalerate dehydrogenase E1 component